MAEKTCIACDGTLDLFYFYRDKASKDGYKARCKPCENSRRMSNARRKRYEENEKGVRTCKRCQQTRPLTDFFKTAHQDPSGIPRYRTVCKTCHMTYTLQWKQEHALELYDRRMASRERRYRTLKLKKYGLTEEQLCALELEAGGMCPLCLQEKRLVVDHSHSTGQVRALLCATCNQGIGLLGEDPEVMRRAIDYLTVHSQ